MPKKFNRAVAIAAADGNIYFLKEDVYKQDKFKLNPESDEYQLAMSLLTQGVTLAAIPEEPRPGRPGGGRRNRPESRSVANVSWSCYLVNLSGLRYTNTYDGDD